MRAIKNKKGADKILSIYWFVVLTLIAGGVFAMAYSFYGNPYDVRDIESQILADKVADCLSYGGRLNTLFVNNGFLVENSQENFLKECNINLNSESEWDEFQYFTSVKFYNLSEDSIVLFRIDEGNINFIADCDITNKKGKDYEKLVKCTEKRIYAVDNYNHQFLIKILTGVRKSEKNVKI